MSRAVDPLSSRATPTDILARVFVCSPVSRLSARFQASLREAFFVPSLDPAAEDGASRYACVTITAQAIELDVFLRGPLNVTADVPMVRYRRRRRFVRAQLAHVGLPSAPYSRACSAWVER
jgi:hypothetical protein